MTVNTRSAGSSAINMADDMAAFDALPLLVRRAMREANITISCADLLELTRSGFSARDVVRLIQREELDEPHEFNRSHHARHGYHLPALTARVSILRGGYAY